MNKAKKGMSKEDIYKKLEDFKTDKERSYFLRRVIEREGLLDKKTKDSIYETLGDLNWSDEALSDFSGEAEQIATGDFKFGDPIIAAHAYARAGNENKAKEIWKALADKVRRRGELFYRTPGYLYGAREFFDSAARYYEKAGLKEKANEMHEILEEIKKTKEKVTLEKKILGVGAFAGFVFSLFFLSSNITGNAIGNLDSASNNFAGLLVLGVSFLLGFLALKK